MCFLVVVCMLAYWTPFCSNSMIVMNPLLAMTRERMRQRVLMFYGPRLPVGFGGWSMSSMATRICIGHWMALDDSFVPKDKRPKPIPKPASKGKHV